MSAPPPPPRRATTSVGPLRVATWGAPPAPPLLLVHGAGAHAGWWDDIAPLLAADWHVVAPDLRGHGGSTRAASYLIEDFAADLLDLADRLQFDAPALVGHSMGGRVCTWIAARHPHRARALALLDTRVGPVPRERAERWRGARPAAAPARTHASRAEAEAAFRLTPSEPEVAPARLAALAAEAVGPTADGRWALRLDRAVLGLAGSRIADLLPLLAQVRCPTLYLRGADSSVVGAAQLAALRAALPDAVIETVPGGHHFPLAHPAPTAARLLNFLRP